MTILKILTNAKWLLSGNFIYAVSQWFLLIVLAKLGTPEMVGQFTLALSIAAPIYMLTNLQLRPIQVADANSIYSFSDYYGLRLIGIAVAMIVIVFLATRFDAETKIVIIVVAAMKGVEAVTDIIHGYLNAKNITSRIAVSLTMKGVGSVLIFALVVALTKKLVIGVSALFFVWIAILIFYDLKSVSSEKCFKFEYKARSFFSLFKKAYPLGVSVMLISLQANIPRYMLQEFTGTASVGIYSALAYVLIIGSVFINSIGQSISPQLAGFWARNDFHGFSRLAFKSMIITGMLGLMAVCAVMAMGQWFLEVFYGDEYAKWCSALLILMIGGAFSYMASILGYAMTAANIIKLQLPIFLALAVFILSVSWYLIPQFGIIGAALAMLATSILQLIISFYTLRKYIR